MPPQVVAGVLTALAGKLFASFQAAPSAAGAARPTNAFQRNLAFDQRISAVVRPTPRLFALGFVAAALGYGLTALLSALRDAVGAARAPPPPVNILGAAAYTGLFVAVVSNVTYQILQGLVEYRLVEPATTDAPKTRATLLFLGRAARSLLASSLAIRGMQLSGLQAVTTAR